MHVGHLRSSIIGDCLQRLYRANGWRVVSDVHLGDWGLQMGQLISEIEIEGIAPIYFDPNVVGPYPEDSPVSMEDLETLYPRASAACKADPARLEAARRATVDLQAGRPGYRALWRHFVTVSEAGLEREFGRRRRRRWGPRELDLDLLVFGRWSGSVPRFPGTESLDPAKQGLALTVPHPEAHRRLFVLAPLADLAPGLAPPGWGETVAMAAARQRTEEGEDAVRPVARWDGRWVELV